MSRNRVTPGLDLTVCVLLGVYELGLTAFAFAIVSAFSDPFDFDKAVAAYGMEATMLETAKMAAFFGFGPLSALPAAITMFWRRRIGAAWLFGGGVISGLVASLWFFGDRGVLMAPIFSVPMIAVGLWQLLSRSETVIEEKESRARRFFSVVAGVLLFLVGWVGTYVLFLVLALNNITGLRGETSRSSPWAQENMDLADSVVLLLVAMAVMLLTLFRKGLRLRWEFLAGQWLAVLLAGIVILAS